MIFALYFIPCIEISQKVDHRLQGKSKKENLHNLGVDVSVFVKTNRRKAVEGTGADSVVKYLEEYRQL